MSNTIHINSAQALTQALQALSQCGIDGSHEFTLKKLPRTRTAKQNRALHKYLELLAKALNDAGWNYWAVLLRRTISAVFSQRQRIKGSDFSDEYKAGYLDALDDIQETLPKAKVDWTMDLVKQNMWKPVQDSQIGKASTADAETHEYTIVYENLNRFTGEKFGVNVSWPSEESR